MFNPSLCCQSIHRPFHNIDNRVLNQKYRYLIILKRPNGAPTTKSSTPSKLKSNAMPIQTVIALNFHRSKLAYPLVLCSSKHVFYHHTGRRHFQMWRNTFQPLTIRTVDNILYTIIVKISSNNLMTAVHFNPFVKILR